MRAFLVGLALWAAAVTPVWADDTPRQPFETWLSAFRAEATAKGISQTTLDAALGGLQPIQRVIELDRRQPEFTQTFWNYLDKRVTSERVTQGRALLKKHADLFAKIEKAYGVQPRFLVAFWGLETNFGGYTGSFPVAGALATLAWDPRRGDFFREQLLALLEGIEAGHIPPDAQGSWAGAMGQCQFMPTTFRAHAVDFDGDGRKDLWGSLADIFASAANFLSKSGWQGDRTWGREVRVPEQFDWSLNGLGVRKPLAEWQRLGVRRIDGRDLPKVAGMEASLVLPAGHKGPAFLVYQNFRTILVWNRSILYAVSVGHLADRLIGIGRLQSPRPAQEVPLARADVEELQRRLARQGFDPGPADGVLGSQTRAAVKAYQDAAMLPADGYADMGLLERLRNVQ